MGTIEDRREDAAKPWGYVVCTDSFMSGWGGARGGRSLYALAVNSPREADIVIRNAYHRTDMKRPRIVCRFRADGTPLVRMHEGDHLAVVDRATADRWYQPDGFADVRK